MAWAWEQDVPVSTKAVLLALADHADNDGTCWPGVKGIAEKCRLSARTVRYHLAILRHKGLVISEERKRDDGTQTANVYHLPVNILTPTLQPITPYPAIHDRETLQPIASHEPSLEPSREEKKEPLSTEVRKKTPTLALTEEDKTVWPDWYGRLWDIPGFKVPLNQAQAWLDKQVISVELAEITAYSLKSKWPGPTKSPYRDVWATFQTWCRRAKSSQNGANNGQSGNHTAPNSPDAKVIYRIPRDTNGNIILGSKPKTML